MQDLEVTLTQPFTRDDWSAFIQAKNSGALCRIDEAIFEYFLEVLPPVYMFREATLNTGRKLRVDFGFAEGAEIVTAFWREFGAYGAAFYCQHTTEVNRG